MPKPPWYIKKFVVSMLLSVAFIQKHFLLPRSAHRGPVHLDLPKICKGTPVYLHPVKYVPSLFNLIELQSNPIRAASLRGRGISLSQRVSDI